MMEGSENGQMNEALTQLENMINRLRGKYVTRTDWEIETPQPPYLYGTSILIPKFINKTLIIKIDYWEEIKDEQ